MRPRVSAAAPILGLLAARFAMLVFLGQLAFLHDRCAGDDTMNWPSALDATALRDLPSVHSITTFPVREPSRRIIHIANQHHLPRDYFKSCMRRVVGTALSDAQIDALYDSKEKEVEAVQADQLLFLQALIKRHRIRSMYFEGLPSIGWFRRTQYQSDKEQLYCTVGARGLLIEQLPVRQRVVSWHREEFAATYGAGGRLFLSGELAKIHGIEPGSSPAHAEQGDEHSTAFLQKRDHEIVKTLLSGDPVAIVILGAKHDLNQIVRTLSHGSCEYIRVETKALWEKSPRVGEVFPVE